MSELGYNLQIVQLGMRIKYIGPLMDRGVPAILDSNITTFLSGVILFQFGTGPIKGFAVTLCVGILTTIITAVYLTRIHYDYRMTSRKLERISI